VSLSVTGDMPVSRIKLVTLIRISHETKGNQCCVLMLWCLILGVPIMQCDAQNVGYEVEVMAIYGRLMQPSFTFQSPAHSTGHLIRVLES
jgi:hypothetical protein